MPRFSVVIPVYKVRGYLRACLDSVLEQDLTEIEVVAVDDASPDGSGRILDEYAAREPRLRVLHLPKNIGLGPARNAGMVHATGDYLLFLDSDDTLLPGSLSALDARLSATAEPDVLVFDYARTHWDGAAERNNRADVLRRAPAEAFAAAEYRELFQLLPVAWNKTYRRTFLERGFHRADASEVPAERMEFRFPEGFYEDVPWLYPVLLGAARIAVLDRVCIHYRQRRTGAGSILQTVSRRHFDVFEQYRRTFDFLELLPEAEQRLWQPVLFGRMARHYLAILEHPARLPAEARAEFFRRASADYRRRSPRGYRPPGGPAGLKERLLARGRRPLTRRLGPVGWAVLRAASRVRRALAELIGGTGPRRRRLNAIAGRCYHRLHRLLPLDPDLVLFEPEDGRNPAGRCEATAIDAELALLAPEFRRIWVGRDGGPGYPLPAGARRVAPGSRGHWRALARASFTVGGSGFGEGFGGGFGHGTAKRRGAVHLQTPPGTPLARIGAEQLDFPAGRQPADPERLLAGVDRWDYCTAANRHAAEVFERSYPGAYATLECGSPANDRLLRARAADVLRIRRHLGVPDGAVAVLYAPTHRDHERRLRPRFDPAEFAAAAGPGFVLLMRAGAGQETPSEQVIDVSAHPSAHELCLASDALLTDYSPLLFDYANLDRPIVLHTEDWELYRSVRGTSLDLLAAPPGHTARQPAAMAELFRTGAYDDESAARLRGEFRSRFCEFDDGQAAERVVRRVFMGEHEPLPFVPPELRCPAPAPPKALAEARAEARAERSVPAPAEAVTLQEANRTKT